MDLQLAGRVVLVTGGSDGLGAAVARALVAEQARVAICARDEARLKLAADELRAAGGDVLAVPADVTDVAALDRFVTAAHSQWGRVDAIVNNAGRSAAGELVSVTDQEWQDDLQLKVFAAIRLSRLVFDHLRASDAAAVVNVLATAAKAPPAASMPSSVSRAAGMALTKALAGEWGPHGIRVNALLVGLVESGQWERRATAAGTSTRTLYERMAHDARIPLGRVGRAEEFADVVTFLLSPRSSYVTGTALNVDGGLSPVV
ncbi:SDR family NAD(P)-dependent oxidoreductase [Candidatus Protofrankia californiensis]|uniref:SDR family NAD(P)-dependent oxidoreductase n=1 Tax=Candidatus Protofrankia californiensis TaxID=1839754 RepID=UPI00104105D3|nr:SDR family oxidoreductase [Candidatus Protofrankia californiensis]